MEGPITLERYLSTLTSLKRTARDRQRLEKIFALHEALPETNTRMMGDQHLVFCVRKKTYAYYLNDYHGDGKIALCCKADADAQRELLARDAKAYFLPPYLGVQGWIALRIDQSKLRWTDAKALLVDAYRRQAPQSLVKALDERA